MLLNTQEKKYIYIHCTFSQHPQSAQTKMYGLCILAKPSLKLGLLPREVICSEEAERVFLCSTGSRHCTPLQGSNHKTGQAEHNADFHTSFRENKSNERTSESEGFGSYDARKKGQSKKRSRGTEKQGRRAESES